VTRWRLAVRLARRDVLRRPGRTALVTLLVALPVAAMVMAVTLIRTDHVTPADEWARHNGTADARAFSSSEPELPEGAVAAPLYRTSVGLRTEGGPRTWVLLTSLDGLEDFAPLGPVLVSGRAPRSDGEVTLSRGALRALDAEVGDTVALVPTGATLTIVGEAEQPDCLSCDVGHATVETMEALLPGPDTALTPDRWLIDLPPMTVDEQVALAEASDGSILTRDLHLAGWQGPLVADPNDDGVRWAYVLGAVALTVVGIVIAATFAVGARRQLVALGQLSASGASPSTLRAALVLQGTVTGVVAALAGLALGAVALVVLRGVIEEHLLDHRIDAYTYRGVEVAGAAVVGVVAATIAALIPARTAAKVPTLAALAGRRPLPPVPRRLVAAGAAAVAGGLALLGLATVGSRSGESGQLWAFVAVVGGVAELLGACAIAPALVARLEPLAAHLRGAWRMAARGLARHRTRTGAVVGAVCAAASLAIAAAALLQGFEAREPEDLEPSPRTVVATVHETLERPGRDGTETIYDDRALPLDGALLARFEAALPDATVTTLRAARPPLTADGSRPWFEIPPLAQLASGGGPTQRASASTSAPHLLVASSEVVDALELTDDQRAALEETGAAVLVPAGDGRELVIRTRSEEPSTSERTIPAVALAVDHHLGWRAGDALVTDETAVAHGLEVEPAATLFVRGEPITQRQRDAVLDLGADPDALPVLLPDLPDASEELPPEGRVESRSLVVDLHQPGSGPSPSQLELALTALALVFSLFVVGTSLALAAAESKDERDVLTVAGASPGLLARMAGARAWLLAALGGLLAVPVGFLPVVVFTNAISDDLSTAYPLVFPTRTVLLLVVAVPTIVALAAQAASAVAQRLRPIRVSTAVFE